ncbi:hypothetical protein BD410DRAFT_437341 [Rickenella mellea]|uniref:F-box domain-containing protein n=1 Tax=Rickenella mellea TaxID=50990 RepID=A0A4Y7PX71_9AGAM|nr:hypothetical protein BD410DRAFT_437341 [Rickenella mellea]
MHPFRLRVQKTNAEGSILLRLPPALIESIMYITARDRFLERTPLGMFRIDSSRYASIRLCHICRYWRQVVCIVLLYGATIYSKRSPLVGYLIGLSRNASLTVSVIIGDRMNLMMMMLRSALYLVRSIESKNTT